MYSAIHVFELNEWSVFMNDLRWDGQQSRTLAAVFLALFLTSCIQEAEWTWTGDTSQQDALADQITQDGTVEVVPDDLPGADTDIVEPTDTDISVPFDTPETIEPTDTDIIEPTDTDVIEPDTADILPGPPVLVVAVPAVFSGESSGGIWTLRPVVPGGATAAQASAGGPWTLTAVLKGGSDAE